MCLGYFDIKENEWMCEDKTVQQDDSTYCGFTGLYKCSIYSF